MKNPFTAIFLKTGNWYSAFILEIPGINTQGKTLKEARGNLKDAMRIFFTANRKLAEKELRKNGEYIEERLAIAV